MQQILDFEDLFAIVSLCDIQVFPLNTILMNESRSLIIFRYFHTCFVDECVIFIFIIGLKPIKVPLKKSLLFFYWKVHRLELQKSKKKNLLLIWMGRVKKKRKMSLWWELKASKQKIQDMRVINDPLGQTHRDCFSSSDHYYCLSFVLFCEVLKSGEGRTYNTCENRYHSLPWLRVGLMDQLCEGHILGWELPLPLFSENLLTGLFINRLQKKIVKNS